MGKLIILGEGEVEGGYFIRVPIKLHWGFFVEEGGRGGKAS